MTGHGLHVAKAMFRFLICLLTRLLLFQGRNVAPEIRALSLATLDDDDLLSTAALFWTQLAWVWILAATGWSWIVLWMALDVALYSVRWRLRRGRYGTPFGPLPPTMSAWSQLHLMILVSVQILFLCHAHSEQTAILGIIMAIGASGYVCGMLAALWVLAISSIVMLNATLGMALLFGFSDNARGMAWLSIASGAFFCTLLRRSHVILLRAIQAQEANRQLSLHDPLTRLPNRILMRDRLTGLVSMLGRQDGPGAIAVLCLDLDGFKTINDRHGHSAGDWILVHVADILRRHLLAGDLASRIGGDEYVVLLADAGQMRAHAVADAIIDDVGVPVDIGGVIPVRIGVSIGIVLATDRSRDVNELLEQADAALYAAKRKGKSCQYLGEASDAAMSPA